MSSNLSSNALATLLPLLADKVAAVIRARRVPTENPQRTYDGNLWPFDVELDFMLEVLVEVVDKIRAHIQDTSPPPPTDPAARRAAGLCSKRGRK